MANAKLGGYWEEFHRAYLQDAAAGATIREVMLKRNFTPGEAQELLDFITARVTAADVRAWMIQAGAELPGFKPKKHDGGSHGAKTRDAFIVTRISGKPFMPGLFGAYKDALDASSIADMPTKIDRYSIPLTTEGDYCEKCVEIVVKASLNRADVVDCHED